MSFTGIYWSEQLPAEVQSLSLVKVHTTICQTVFVLIFPMLLINGCVNFPAGLVFDASSADSCSLPMRLAIDG